jgi:acetolactate synthase small subunit
MPQAIGMWMEDKPGALMRVAGVVTTKGCSIESLTVVLDPCRPCASRVIIVADIEPYLHCKRHPTAVWC